MCDQVYAVTAQNAQLLVRLCGNTLPNPVFLNTSSALLLFVSDYSLAHPGYDITYTASDVGMTSLVKAQTLN